MCSSRKCPEFPHRRDRKCMKLNWNLQRAREREGGVTKKFPLLGRSGYFVESHTHAFVMIYVKFHRSVCFVIKCATKIFLFTPPDHCCLPLKKVLDIRSKLMSTSTFMDSLFMVELNFNPKCNKFNASINATYYCLLVMSLQLLQQIIWTL